MRMNKTICFQVNIVADEHNTLLYSVEVSTLVHLTITIIVIMSFLCFISHSFSVIIFILKYVLLFVTTRTQRNISVRIFPIQRLHDEKHFEANM